MGKCCKCGRETKNEVPYYARDSVGDAWQACSAYFCAKCGYLPGAIIFAAVFLLCAAGLVYDFEKFV